MKTLGITQFPVVVIPIRNWNIYHALILNLQISEKGLTLFLSVMQQGQMKVSSALGRIHAIT